jgi:UDP-N-acetylglucosamine 2-epimerase (non-hydrolysing)
MTHVLFAFGTRPEAIKLAPVIQHLQKYPDTFKVTVCLTSQHKELLRQVIEFFGIKEDVDLDVMVANQTLEHITSEVLSRMRGVLEKYKPDIVLVQGDTTTVFTASLAAFYQKIAVGHVEAGLRTDNKYSPFPEEINRRLTGVITDLHFAPTEQGRRNLLREGYGEDSIFVTGNTVVDALLLGKALIEARGPSARRQLLLGAGIGDETVASMLDGAGKFILVTAHRRESFGAPFERMCRAMLDIVERNGDVQIVYPVHPNPNVRSVVNRMLSGNPRIHLIEPVPYEQLLLLMDTSYILLTDSGGIQEEGPSLNKPVLVMRETTERPEGIEAGVSRLVGTDTALITGTVQTLLDDDGAYSAMAGKDNPYGDGKASTRIAEIISARFESR